MFSFEINNYRSFINERFKFSRVNILIGENSSGKSSFLKFLLALKQTVNSPNESNLKLSGDFTDLGNYEEAVYYRQKHKKIGFTFEANEKYFEFYLQFIEKLLEEKVNSKILKKFVYEEGINNKSSTKLKYILSSKLQDHSSIKTQISNDIIGKIEVIQRKDSDQTILRQRYCDILYKFKDIEGILTECDCGKRGFQTIVSASILSKIQLIHGEDMGIRVFLKIAFLLVVQNYFYETIEKIKFVNPIGSIPKRFYFREDKKSNYKLIDIEKLVNIFGDPSLNQKLFIERLQLLNKSIRDFGIAEEIQVIKNKELPVIGLNVKTADHWSNIVDVGYGVSLQLPILFQAILSENYTKDGEIILIEQPEVHLHPSLQAKFIETLLKLGRKNSYFIETHSEHIIRKLQVIVKNKELDITPQDISIHYFKRSEEKFQVTSHSINEQGRLLPGFPDGFYDVSYTLAKQLI